MTRSNIGYTESLGDLVDLLNGVSSGSTSNPNSKASSGRAPQHSNWKVIDDECDDDDIANSGIRKVDSYPGFCTNKAYLARHRVCMVDITRHSGENEKFEFVDASDDEEQEYDDNGNVKINMDRLEWRTRRSEQEAAGNANAATAGANGAQSTPGIGLGGVNGGGNTGTPVNVAQRRRRPLLELSQEMWDETKDVFENICFLGPDVSWDELMSYHYMFICKRDN
jgi:hypothetical protein